jgi:hypothetical protein
VIFVVFPFRIADFAALGMILLIGPRFDRTWIASVRFRQRSDCERKRFSGPWFPFRTPGVHTINPPPATAQNAWEAASGAESADVNGHVYLWRVFSSLTGIAALSNNIGN